MIDIVFRQYASVFLAVTLHLLFIYIGYIFCVQVAKKLATEFPGMYNETNVAVSGIHTHSGPGGFHQYILLDVTSLGFVKQSMDALVTGIVEVCI